MSTSTPSSGSMSTPDQHTCPVCASTFPILAYLTHHITIHSEENLQPALRHNSPVRGSNVPSHSDHNNICNSGDIPEPEVYSNDASKLDHSENVLHHLSRDAFPPEDLNSENSSSKKSSSLLCSTCSKAFTSRTSLERHVSECSKKQEPASPAEIEGKDKDSEDEDIDKSLTKVRLRRIVLKDSDDDNDDGDNDDNDGDNNDDDNDDGYNNNDDDDEVKHETDSMDHEPTRENERQPVVLTYECDVCQKIYKSAKTLSRHLKGCEKTGVETCRLCGDEFRGRRQLQLHLKSHTANLLSHYRQEALDLSDSLGVDADVTLDSRIDEEDESHRESSPQRPPAKRARKSRAKTRWGRARKGKVKTGKSGRGASKKGHTTTHPETNEQDEGFTCKECDKKFMRKASLHCHMLIHNKETPYTCDLCERAFKHWSRLKLHQDQDHFDLGVNVDDKGLKNDQQTDCGGKAFRCTVCHREFRLSSALRGHRCARNGEHDTGRKGCGADEQGRDSSEKGRDTDEKECETEGSESDENGVGAEENRLKSEETVERKKTVRKRKPRRARSLSPCDVCDRTFLRAMEKVVHMRYHTGDKPFKCPTCGKAFHIKGNMISHLQTHDPDRAFSCDVCGKKFINKAALQRHMLTHTGEKPYPCDLCEREFRHWTSLKLHKDRVHFKRKPHLCDLCGKGFVSTDALKVHQRTHTGEKPFKCEVCPKSFAQVAGLNAHRRTHTGERPFTCTICNRGFYQSSALKDHQVTHTGEKPFQCDVCQKAFSLKCALTRHLKTHTGEKPFQCEICAKCFASNGQLKHHMKQHTGEKPFQCEVCGQAFAHRSNFKKHLRELHPDYDSGEFTVYKIYSREPQTPARSAMKKAASTAPATRNLTQLNPVVPLVRPRRTHSHNVAQPDNASQPLNININHQNNIVLQHNGTQPHNNLTQDHRYQVSGQSYTAQSSPIPASYDVSHAHSMTTSSHTPVTSSVRYDVISVDTQRQMMNSTPQMSLQVPISHAPSAPPVQYHTPPPQYHTPPPPPNCHNPQPATFFQHPGVPDLRYHSVPMSDSSNYVPVSYSAAREGSLLVLLKDEEPGSHPNHHQQNTYQTVNQAL